VIDAIRAAVPKARIVNVDPLCHVHPATPELQADADKLHGYLGV